MLHSNWRWLAAAMVMTALNRGKSSQHDLDYTSAFSLAESVADKAKRLGIPLMDHRR